MIMLQLNQKRLLVPRWRSLEITLNSRELAIPVPSVSSFRAGELSPELREKISRWKFDPGVITAGELLGAALVENKEGEASGAAQFVLSKRSSATMSLQRLATRSLHRSDQGGSTRPLQASGRRQEKALWRRRTRAYPANALAWVELSLRDVVVGKRHTAERSMLVALGLAPTNRHVVRSACRLFLHLGDRERAYDIVGNCAATQSDPWLMAAELSVADLADKRPKYFKQARRLMADENWVPRQTTELAGAIGTLELGDGHAKKARQYFRRSVCDPTGSALAQAEWASTELGEELVSNKMLYLAPEGDEARAFHLMREENLKPVPDVCMRWAEAEPYSIRPYEMACSATCLVGNHKRSIEIAERGLKIRPKAETLLNGYAFALAHLGNIEKAEKSLDAIGNENEGVWFVSQANRGLLAMRKGRVDIGLDYYGKAINGFQKLGDWRSADIARIYRAREAALAGSDDAASLVEDAHVAVKRLRTRVHGHVIIEAKKALSK